MFIHCFAFRWKDGTTEAQKEQAAHEILALQGQIPGLLETLVGANTSPRSHGYEFGGVMRFTSRAAFTFYNDHPAHEQLLTWLLPIIDPMELDFEIP